MGWLWSGVGLCYLCRDMDPGWVVAVAIVVTNGIGWGVTYRHWGMEEAKRQGRMTGQIEELCRRMGKVEEKIDECMQGVLTE